MHRISMKFDRPMWANEKTSWVVLYDDVTNPRWRTTAMGHNFGVRAVAYNFRYTVCSFFHIIFAVLIKCENRNSF